MRNIKATGQSLTKALRLNAGEERVFLCPVSVTKDGGALANWRMEAPLSDRGTKMPFRTQGTVLLQFRKRLPWSKQLYPLHI